MHAEGDYSAAARCFRLRYSAACACMHGLTCVCSAPSALPQYVDMLQRWTTGDADSAARADRIICGEALRYVPSLGCVHV